MYFIAQQALAVHFINAAGYTGLYYFAFPLKQVIIIQYCPKCGWMLRAAYMAQELLTTFAEDIKGVLLQPAEMSGQYTVLVDEQVIFDRKEKGRFPEIKELKQLVRDAVNPGKSLGHSDSRL